VLLLVTKHDTDRAAAMSALLHSAIEACHWAGCCQAFIALSAVKSDPKPPARN